MFGTSPSASLKEADGLKSHDFTYLQPLKFDKEGVVRRLEFTDSFGLQL